MLVTRSTNEVTLLNGEAAQSNRESTNMKISHFNTTKKSLKQLGFKRKPHEIKPDVDWKPDAERVPQAPNYSQMWIDHFNNFGNIRNPLGSPMESGT